MKTAEFDYTLPTELIAQTPIEPRDASRLMVVDRASGQVSDHQFDQILEMLRPGDILVANDSRVIPARLFARKPTGGQVEILLLRALDETRWEALVGGKRVRAGSQLIVQGKDVQVTASVLEELNHARRVLEFDQPIMPLLDELGHTPLPPYIHTVLDDPERYQTIYSRVDGSAAAPTAGLHFTPDLLLALRERRVNLAFVTLHIGLDTFRPVDAEDLADHTIHTEWATLTPEVARQINDAKLGGGRVVAVGTTVVRTLETAALRGAGVDGSLCQASQQSASACPWQSVAALDGPTDLFIYPGFQFQAVDLMLTNFHLPRSTLLMLVSAFAGQELIRRAYQMAVAEHYRFFSFGDAMLIL